MTKITYINRQTGQKETEKVYQERALRFFYGSSFLSRLMKAWALPAIVKWPLFSRLIGRLQKLPSSARKIIPFIQEFGVDPSEFLDPVSSFRSFNDFFIRRLKPSSRPIDKDPKTAVIPADGRYYFYADSEKSPGFIVKGQKFELRELIGQSSLANEFEGGSMAIARLCPSDYHRFHFPCDCVAGPVKLINGALYSVNPIAIKKNIRIFTENKRMLCQLDTPVFGRALYIEIGATTVGSIQQTYFPGERQEKGTEKGYFEFGGSALILLFAKNAIAFDADLLAATQEGFEIRCLLGQSMGKAVQ